MSESIGKQLIDRLKNINDRLQAAGGHIEATGLRTTTYRRCDDPQCLRGECYEIDDDGLDGLARRYQCPRCNGTGVIRTVNDGTGASN